VAEKRRLLLAVNTAPVPSFVKPLKPPAAVQTPLPTTLPHTTPVKQAPQENQLDHFAVLSLPPQIPAQASSASSEWQELRNEIDQYIREQQLDNVVGVVSTEHELMLSLSDTITFSSGQTTLSPVVTQLLQRVSALAIKRPDLDIEIAGHTDDRPIATTEFPSNWELSAARASRVARALLQDGRIDPSRISTRGYAHYRAVYANDTEEHRAANRRVEIRFFRRVGTAGTLG
jgi:chemotaxis protein MotB